MFGGGSLDNDESLRISCGVEGASCCEFASDNKSSSVGALNIYEKNKHNVIFTSKEEGTLPGTHGSLSLSTVAAHFSWQPISQMRQRYKVLTLIKVTAKNEK